MAGFLGNFRSKGDKKKKPLTGVAKVITMIKSLPAVVVVVLGATVVIALLSFFYDIFHWITDYNSSYNNPETLYDMIGSESLNELVTIAGNEEDGYYIAFKEGADEKLDEIVEEFRRPNYQTVTKEDLFKMIEAELYTQYPNLGGKVGKEADIKLGESYLANRCNGHTTYLSNTI